MVEERTCYRRDCVLGWVGGRARPRAEMELACYLNKGQNIWTLIEANSSHKKGGKLQALGR